VKVAISALTLVPWVMLYQIRMVFVAGSPGQPMFEKLLLLSPTFLPLTSLYIFVIANTLFVEMNLTKTSWGLGPML